LTLKTAPSPARDASSVNGETQGWKNLVFRKVFRFLVLLGLLGFYVFLVLMYEDQTQNYETKIHNKNISYMIHPFPCHIIYSHVQTIA